MQHILAIVTVVVTGVMVGVEFAVAVFINPILDRLPDDYGLAARSDGARILGKVMPVWYVCAVVLSAIWAALAWGGTGAAGAAGAAAGPVTAATALLILSVLMSVTLLVPIASRSAQWTPEDHPADWKQQSRRWDRYHYARVSVIIAAFVLMIVGIA